MTKASEVIEALAKAINSHGSDLPVLLLAESGYRVPYVEIDVLSDEVCAEEGITPGACVITL